MTTRALPELTGRFRFEKMLPAMAPIRSLGLRWGRALLVACLLAGCGGGGKVNPDGAAGSGATGRGGTTGAGAAAGNGAAGSGAAGTGGAAGATGSAGAQGSDCTATPCTGLAYCDLGSHQCKPGCAFNSQCASTEIC